jgi:hypothetical protein
MEFINGKMEELTKVYKILSLTFSGHWKEDLRHGEGCFKIGENIIYFGEWENDKWNGHGTFLWIDGDYYEGRTPKKLKIKKKR